MGDRILKEANKAARRVSVGDRDTNRYIIGSEQAYSESDSSDSDYEELPVRRRRQARKAPSHESSSSSSSDDEQGQGPPPPVPEGNNNNQVPPPEQPEGEEGDEDQPLPPPAPPEEPPDNPPGPPGGGGPPGGPPHGGPPVPFVPHVPHQEQHARHATHRHHEQRQRFIVPASVPNFSGIPTGISLEEWIERIATMANICHWNDDESLLVMIEKLEKPASDYIWGLPYQARQSMHRLMHVLFSRYGADPATEADHLRAIMLARHQPNESGRTFIDRLSPHFRYLRFNNNQKVILLLPLLQTSYAEEIRRRGITRFNDAVNAIYKYDIFLNASTQNLTVNAVQHDNTIQALEEAATRARDEIRQLKSQLAAMQHGAKKPWCSLHKTSRHDESECNKLKQMNARDRDQKRTKPRWNQQTNEVSTTLGYSLSSDPAPNGPGPGPTNPKN